MKKTSIILAGALLVPLIIGTWFLLKQNTTDSLSHEEKILQETYNLSKKYLLLRVRTDDILVKAEEYAEYSAWDEAMTMLVQDWEKLADESQALESSASKTAEVASIDFQFIKAAQAYSAKEVTAIYDKAPKFKGIATLAKHLGVDAKRAQVILDQAQAEMSSEVFTEEGDAFENLENTAIVVKDGCKVAGFVGGVVLTGGAAGLAAAGTLTQVTVVVAGADLALEITEDGAQIALGDKNKVSSFVKDVRTVTEPVASVLSITNIPSNLGTAYGKIDAVFIALEQFRESAQEGKVVGVDLTNFESHRSFQVIRKTKYPGTVTVAEMEKAEVEDWLKSLNKKPEPMTQTEIMDFLSNQTKDNEPKENLVEEKAVLEETKDPAKADEELKSPEAESSDVEQLTETNTGSITTQTMAGTYSGSAILQHVEEDVETPDSMPVTLQLNESGTGTVNVNGYTGEASLAGNNVNFSVTMKDSGATVYCTFKGRAAANGNNVTISGTMKFTMMGVTFASYGWSAQK